MKFRNDRQKAEVSRTICGWFGRSDLWTLDPPGPAPVVTEARRVFAFDDDDHCLLGIAWTIWGGHEHYEERVTVSDVLRLDNRYVTAIGELLKQVATGTSDGIDRWIVTNRSLHLRPGG